MTKKITKIISRRVMTFSSFNIFFAYDRCSSAFRLLSFNDLLCNAASMMGKKQNGNIFVLNFCYPFLYIFVQKNR